MQITIDIPEEFVRDFKMTNLQTHYKNSVPEV